MQIKTLFQVSALTSALILAGCGGDIKIQPTVIDNSIDNSTTTTGGSGSETNPCASNGVIQGKYDGTDCTYSTAFASKNIQIENDITFLELANGGVHVFDGALLIGKDCNTTTSCTIDTDGPVMTVEPGATLAFTSGEAILRIARGAKINAVGTFNKPITFTSANAIERLDVVGDGPQFADWGGIIINGFGVTNKCTNAQRAAETCNVETEGVTSYYGGNDNEDSSGNIAFAKIWYAGSGPKVGGEGDDLNSLTLNAVGSGSSFDYLHIHQGYDDGIEFFGGAATISHIVVTDTQDDGIDIDGGWQGKAQYLLVKHGTVTTKKDVVVEGVTIPAGSEVFMGNNGFETDGQSNSTIDDAAYSEAPSSNPTIANVTVITTDGKSVRDNSSSQAFKFDDAIETSYYNVLMVKADGTNGTTCIEHSGDGELHADKISFTSSVMVCENEFKGGTAFTKGPLTGTNKTEWFDNSGSSVRIAHNSVVLVDGFASDLDSGSFGSVTATDPSSLGSFFEAATYVGAVSENDTSSNWYKWAKAAIEASLED